MIVSYAVNLMLFDLLTSGIDIGAAVLLVALNANVAIPRRKPQSYDCKGTEASFLLLRKSSSNLQSSAL